MATGCAAKRIRRKRDLSASTSSSRTSRPFSIIPTRSANVSTPARSCVVMKMVVPRSARSPITSSNSDLRATTSRPSVGSSSTSSSGEFARARASDTCFFWPFDRLPKRLDIGTPNVRSRVSTLPWSHRSYSREQKRAMDDTFISGGASASSVTMPMRCMRPARRDQASSPNSVDVPCSGFC